MILGRGLSWQASLALIPLVMFWAEPRVGRGNPAVDASLMNDVSVVHPPNDEGNALERHDFCDELKLEIWISHPLPPLPRSISPHGDAIGDPHEDPCRGPPLSPERYPSRSHHRRSVRTLGSNATAFKRSNERSSRPFSLFWSLESLEAFLAAELE